MKNTNPTPRRVFPDASFCRAACRRVFTTWCILALATACLPDTRAAIAIDATASTSATNAASITWSHPVASGASVLIVGLATEDTTSSILTPSAITYNGVALTAVPSAGATAGASTFDRAQLFYLLNPPSGTHSVAVTFGGAVNNIAAGSVSLNGTTGAPGSAVTATASSGATIAANANVATAGSWLIDVVCSGASSATFTAGAGQTIRWSKAVAGNGGASSTQAPATTGATADTYTASSSSQLALAVAVLTPAGSSTATAPTITTQPASQTVAAGGTASFSVAATGTAPLAYQWAFNGTAISGATNATYSLSNAQSSNAGTYTITVSNSAGSTTSNGATLTVTTTATAPTITTQPSSQTVAAGSTASFSVAATGTAPLAYQWAFGGTAISGATNATYSISNVQPSNAGNYTVTVSNSAGSATSTSATLTVTTATAGTAAPTISSQPSHQSVADGGTISLSVTASGTAPLAYQWYRNGTALSGATAASLTISGAHPANAGAYTVVVTNAAGSDTSEVATVVTQPVIPSRTFLVTSYGAVGDGATVNTTAIQNAINAASAAGGGTVEIPAAAKPYLSDHLTLASSVRLQVDSGATLQALPPSQYANASVNFITAGDFTNGITAHDVAIIGPGTIDGNGSAWWSQSTRPKLIHIDNTTTAMVANLTLQNSPKMHLMTLGTNNVTLDHLTISAPGTSPNTDGIDPSGSDYLITNCNVSVGDDNVVLKAESVACANITVDHCTFGTGHGASIGAQTNLGVNGYRVTNCSFSGTDYVVRLKAQRGEGGLVQNVLYDHITFSGITKAPVYVSSYYDSLPSNPSSDPGQAITSTSLTPQWRNLTIRNLNGTTVSSPSKGLGDVYGLPEAPIANVLFDNVTLSGTTKTLTINHARNVQFVNNCSVALNTSTTTSLYDVGPIITAEPRSQQVSAGSTVTFTVTSVSATAQTYQWRKDGAAIAGATGAALTLGNVQAANAGAYSVAITNSVKSGTATTISDDALLQVQ